MIDHAGAGSDATCSERTASPRPRIGEQVEFTWDRDWVVPPKILAPGRMRCVQRETPARVSFAGFATFEGAVVVGLAWARR